MTSWKDPTSTGVEARQEIGLGGQQWLRQKQNYGNQGNERPPSLLVEVTTRKRKLPMKSYPRTLNYINHSDPRFATPPFQTFVLQIWSFITDAEVGSCLPVNTENQPGRVYQSTVTAPQMFAQCCLWISCQTTGTHKSAWNRHHYIQRLELYLDTAGNIRGI